MFTMEEVLSKRNQADAMSHILNKKNSHGNDGIELRDFKDYWQLNQEEIKNKLLTGEYIPGTVTTYEVINGRGKVRRLSNLNVIDKYISRLLLQKMRRYIEPNMCKNSYAFQGGKGVLDAVKKAKEYIDGGDVYVCEIDIKSFFDNINHDRMFKIIQEYISDERLKKLIERYIKCTIEHEGFFYIKQVGILQGNAISPMLSNMYLHKLDTFMNEKGYHWVRFADDINVYATSMMEAEMIYEEIAKKIKNEFLLNVNDRKSCVRSVMGSTYLGYDFYKYAGQVEIRKHSYRRTENYSNWHRCSIQKVNHEFHIVQNGVINKKDYALLFENEHEKHHIPVETIDQLNIYSNVTISSPVISTLAKENIKVVFIDKYGENIGSFVPEGYNKDAKTCLQQAVYYADEKKRKYMARELEKAGFHNMRQNLMYYVKKNELIKLNINEFEKIYEELKTSDSIDNMMLLEARAKKCYYNSFNLILNDKDFAFTERSKRPPRDEINALMSFGNTLLYNEILKMIWQTSLKPQIGIVHAANRRNYVCNCNL